MNTDVLTRPEARIDLGGLRRKKVSLAIFGKGNVGSELIDQLLNRKGELTDRRNLDLHIFCIANSKGIYLGQKIDGSWRKTVEEEMQVYDIQAVIDYAKSNKLANCIAIDNTASAKMVGYYPLLIANGFHLVSSNKIANTGSLNSYRELRELLAYHHKEYLYETNVGAGLPLIDTIKLLHLSGENITRIRGVFSGSLSYIFNRYSEGSENFSEVVINALRNGYTEPDPREDLSGDDVARKLLILARELDLNNEWEDIIIENLIPKDLRNNDAQSFLSRLTEMDVPYHIKRKNLPKDHVFRYVADLKGNLMQEDGGQLSVTLETVPKSSVLGQLKGSDSLFEIYTETYGKHPIVIQGAGAGAAVTARGVFGDILRLSEKL